ncbi:MAG: nucleotidyltransferase domain-containing protein [Candidatus Sericytochromatia bacterium]|nr:nucleotidyltransferase domain-containing protein [Candidatus Sericytochromatia bacterium]
MRLTPRQATTVQRVVLSCFGTDAEVRLFGSRLRDDARGGDFDFLVTTRLTDPEAMVEARLAALCELHATPEFEDEKIDLVVLSPLTPRPSAIHELALREGVLL